MTQWGRELTGDHYCAYVPNAPRPNTPSACVKRGNYPALPWHPRGAPIDIR